MVKIETKLPKEKKKAKKKGSTGKLIVWLVIAILLVFGAAFSFWTYKTVMSPNGCC